MSAVVLVTGAAGSIGRAICACFLRQGDTVVALDLDGPALEVLAREVGSASGRLIPVNADVTNEPAIAATIDDLAQKVGAISVLINNAGGNLTTLLDETSPQQWRADIELNLNAAFYVCSAVIPGMLAEGGGCIINIGSVNGLAIYSDPAYSVAKAGLIHYTKFLATEYGRRGIRANVICPGTVKTAAWTNMLSRKPDLYARLSRLCSLGEIAEPEDIAAAVRFLASKDARMIHGSTLVIDGGLSAGVASIMSAFATHDIL